jgi:hypothetical protein
MGDPQFDYDPEDRLHNILCLYKPTPLGVGMSIFSIRRGKSRMASARDIFRRLIAHLQFQ